MSDENQGLSLDDLVPASEQVEVPNPNNPDKPQKLIVNGISAEGIVSVFKRFPQVKQWVTGTGIKVAELVNQFPAAVAAIIVVCTADRPNNALERKAARLSVETQLDILEAIGRLSFKNGFGPFVQRVVALSELAASVNYGRVPATKSPPVSKPLSPVDTGQPKFGP